MQLSRERPPRRSSSRQDIHSNSMIQTFSPNRRTDSPMSVIKQIFRILMDKITQLQNIIQSNNQHQRRKKLITLNQKQPPSPRLTSSPHHASFAIQTNSKLQSLIQSLQPSPSLKLTNSPITHLFDQLDVKQLISKQTTLLRADIEELKQRFKDRDQQLQNTFSNYQDQLTSLIIAFKDSIVQSSSKRINTK